MSIPVDTCHLGRLSLPVKVVILNDAYGVNPQIGNMQALGDFDNVSKGFWEVRDGYPSFVLF